jgi:hypothetical protein
MAVTRTRVRSETAPPADAFRFPPRVPVSELLREPVAPPPPRARRRARTGIAWLHIPLELLFGAALACAPPLLGLPIGVDILAVPMGLAILVMALNTPVSALPLRGQRLYDRIGIDILLVGLAVLLWLIGEQGGGVLFLVAAGAHAALIALTRRLGAQRNSPFG